MADVTLQAVRVRAAEMNALEARDWLIYKLAKAERLELVADEMFNPWDFVQACKENGVDWEGACHI